MSVMLSHWDVYSMTTKEILGVAWAETPNDARIMVCGDMTKTADSRAVPRGHSLDSVFAPVKSTEPIEEQFLPAKVDFDVWVVLPNKPSIKVEMSFVNNFPASQEVMSPVFAWIFKQHAAGEVVLSSTAANAHDARVNQARDLRIEKLLAETEPPTK